MFCLIDLYMSISLTYMAIATDGNLTLLINEFDNRPSKELFLNYKTYL